MEWEATVWDLGSNPTHSLEAPVAIEAAGVVEPVLDANRHTWEEEATERGWVFCMHDDDDALDNRCMAAVCYYLSTMQYDK